MTVMRVIVVLGGVLALVLSWTLPRLDAPQDRLSVAIDLIEDGRGGDAVHLLDDRVWRGVAEYRTHRFRRAATEFVQDEGVMALYNLGTAYARLGEWAAARAAYEKALDLDPGHEDAAFNLALVLQAEAQQLQEQEDQRQTRSLGTEKGTPGQNDQQAGAENEETTTDGARPSEDAAPTERQPTQAGQIAAEGRTGDEASEQNTAAGRGGAAVADEPEATGQMGSGGTQLLTESTRDIQTLLRAIQDDPERVLAARLRAIHRQRREAGQ